MAAYIANWWVGAAEVGAVARRRSAYAWAAATALAVLLVNLWVYGLHKMEAWKGSRLQARAALTYIRLFEPAKVGRLDATLEFVREGAEELDRQSLHHHPLAEEWGFGPYRPAGDSLGSRRAKLTLVRLSGDTLYVDGFSLLPNGRIADGVLISVRGADGGDWRVIGFAEMRSLHALNNTFLDTHFGQGPNLAYVDQYARFRGSALLPKSVDREAPMLKCWAIDAEQMRAFPIGDERDLTVQD